MTYVFNKQDGRKMIATHMGITNVGAIGVEYFDEILETAPSMEDKFVDEDVFFNYSIIGPKLCRPKEMPKVIFWRTF